MSADPYDQGFADGRSDAGNDWHAGITDAIGQLRADVDAHNEACRCDWDRGVAVAIEKIEAAMTRLPTDALTTPASAGEPKATTKDLQNRTEEYECATSDTCRFDSRCPNYAMNCQRFEGESDRG